MTGVIMTTNYSERLRRVYGAIHDDPARAWSLDDLAGVAALSRFHFHRVFTAMTGESVAEALRRVRLNRAAHALVRGDQPVAAVGRACGYANAAAFTRAFRLAYGVTPGVFRKQGQALPLKLAQLGKGGNPMYPVTIQSEPAHRVIGVPFTGPYLEIGAAFDRLSAEVSALNLWPQTRGMVGVYFDDPSLVAPEALRSLAGVLVGPGLALPEGMTERILTGGRHARMRFGGPYVGLGVAYEWLFGAWLADSGEAPRAAPCWEVYHNTPMTAAPEDLLTDIYLPLEDQP
jgi:AraC family transcriptional regulator